MRRFQFVWKALSANRLVPIFHFAFTDCVEYSWQFHKKRRVPDKRIFLLVFPLESHLHLFVPTLLLPANQGSRMKMQRKVSLLLIPRNRAGLSESRRPLRNQCTVCFFRELFRVIFLTEPVLHHHAGNGQFWGFEGLFSFPLAQLIRRTEKRLGDPQL